MLFKQKQAADPLTNGAIPTRDDIDGLYQDFLGRRLEDNDVYAAFWNRLEWRECVSRMLDSREYKEHGALRHVDVELTVCAPTRFDFLMPVSLREPMTLRAYLMDDYEAKESDFIQSTLSPGDVAVDLGARHGWFTGIMAAAVGRRGRVFSFEPRSPAAGVRQLIEINHLDNVAFIEAGAADVAGVLRFDGATLSVSETGHDVIELTTLDAVFSGVPDRVKLIKADIEGAELLAFKGGARLLARDHPTLVFEIYEQKLEEVSKCTGVELIDWLRARGYRTFRTFDGEDAGTLDFSSEIVNVVATA